MKLISTLVLILIAAHWTALGAGAAELELRLARPPSASERDAMERWYRLWRTEAGPVERSFGALARLARKGGSPDLRPRCLELGEALLELDRERVLPAPNPAVDLHLRDGLRALTRAAVTCLTKRPYKARHALAEAETRFRQVARVLRTYDLEPGARSERSAPAGDP